MELLTTTHSKHISGVLSCFDRIILTGKLPQVCYAQGKYLHYYFYFIDPYLGYGYVRVPTWCPFKLQIYINGHNILANKLDKCNIQYSMLDNIRSITSKTLMGHKKSTTAWI
jgi:hypothetical protein